jgi:hypothetical protein
MRFIDDMNIGEPVSRCFRDSITNAVATEFSSIPLTSEQREIMLTSFLLELYEVLGGSVPFSGRNGPAYLVVTLNTESLQTANIFGNGVEVELVTDHAFFDESQVDLLFHIVDMLDSRFVYLGWTQECIIRVISAVALAICRILDGSATMQSSDGHIRPCLAFSRVFGSLETITSGRTSWMQQYVAGVVPKHFETVDGIYR